MKDNKVKQMSDKQRRRNMMLYDLEKKIEIIGDYKYKMLIRQFFNEEKKNGVVYRVVRFKKKYDIKNFSFRKMEVIYEEQIITRNSPKTEINKMIELSEIFDSIISRELDKQEAERLNKILNK